MATKASAYTTIYRILAFLLVSQSLYSQYSDMLAVDPKLRMSMSYLTQVNAEFSGPSVNFSPTYPQGEFDNGYVNDSSGLGSDTWDWGFNESSQILKNDLISFSRTSFSGPQFSSNPTEGSAGLRFDWIPNTLSTSRMAFSSVFSLDARLLDIESQAMLPAGFETLTKYYSHANFDPTLLTLPHAGTDGDPLLSSSPSKSKTFALDDGATLHRYMGLEGALISLGAGGEVHIGIIRNLSLFLQAQVLANLYFGKFEHGEYFLLNEPYGRQNFPYGQRNASHDISEMLFGLSGGAGFQWRFGDYSSLLFSVSKIINEKLEGNESGYNYYLNLNDGYYMVAGIQIEY